MNISSDDNDSKPTSGLVYQSFIGKDGNNWPTLVDYCINSDGSTAPIVNKIESLVIWITALCKSLSENDLPVPICDDIDKIIHCLNESTKGRFTFKPDLDKIFPSCITELNFDNIRMLDKMGLIATIHNFHPFEDDNTTDTHGDVVCINIKYEYDNKIMNYVYQISTELCDENEPKEDNNKNKKKKRKTDKGFKANADVIEIPYFECSGGSNLTFRLVDIPFIISPTFPTKYQKYPPKVPDILFNNVTKVNKYLYSKCACYLRDYAYYSNGKFIYDRNDPMNKFYIQELIPTQFRNGVSGVNSNSGALMTNALAFDHWSVRERWGQYSEDLSNKLDIIYVGLHSSHFDDKLLGFPDASFKIYGTSFLLDQLGEVKEDVHTNILFGTIYRQSYHQNSTTDQPTNEFVELIISFERLPIILSTFLKTGKTDFMSFADLKAIFEEKTLLKESYLDLLCHRLLPFICREQSNAINGISLKDGILIRLHTICGSSEFKGALNYEIKECYSKNVSMLYFYNDRDKFFEEDLGIPSYKSITGTFCTANFDKAIVEITNSRKKGLIPYLDFGYEDLLQTGRSLLEIAIEVCRICHASIHEVFHGGKDLWHLRGIEYIMAMSQKPKPNRMVMTEVKKYGQNSHQDDEKEHVDDENTYENEEKWDLLGAHVGKESRGWFVDNRDVVAGNDIFISMFLDFDGYYNSIICEYNIGFICHNGQLLKDVHLNNTGDSPFMIIGNNSESGMDEKCVYTSGELSHHFSTILSKRREIKKGISEGILDKNSPSTFARYTALKLVSNTFYGCCGKEKSSVVSKFISNLITSYGRRGEMYVIRIVTEKYKLKVGLSHTDGICIKIPRENYKYMTEKILEDINSTFDNHFIKFTLEETFDSLFIKNKTSYIGIRDSKTWIEDLNTIVPIVLNGLNEKHAPSSSCSFFHNMMLLIQDSKRGNSVIRWDELRKRLEKNIKIKGLKNKNWPFAEIIALYIGILSHSLLPHRLGTLKKSLARLSSALVDGISKNPNPLIWAICIISKDSNVQKGLYRYITKIKTIHSTDITDTKRGGEPTPKNVYTFSRQKQLFDDQFDIILCAFMETVVFGNNNPNGGYNDKDDTFDKKSMYKAFYIQMMERCSLDLKYNFDNLETLSSSLSLTLQLSTQNGSNDSQESISATDIINVTSPLQLAQLLVFTKASVDIFGLSTRDIVKNASSKDMTYINDSFGDDALKLSKDLSTIEYDGLFFKTQKIVFGFSSSFIKRKAKITLDSINRYPISEISLMNFNTLSLVRAEPLLGDVIECNIDTILPHLIKTCNLKPNPNTNHLEYCQQIYAIYSSILIKIYKKIKQAFIVTTVKKDKHQQ